jgi:hypothetical protein
LLVVIGSVVTALGSVRGVTQKGKIEGYNASNTSIYIFGRALDRSRKVELTIWWRLSDSSHDLIPGKYHYNAYLVLGCTDRRHSSYQLKRPDSSSRT